MDFQKQAKKLVDEFIRPQGLTNEKILSALLKVPRHEFVPKEYKNEAYLDIALPIGENQTISQPSLVALMTQSLHLKGGEKVLEIGTGSGYQAAILSYLAKEVYSVEILPKLAQKAQKTLKKLHLANVQIFKANGTIGLKQFAPYDAIIVTAGGREIPNPLIDQLKDGGRIVIPVGDNMSNQDLIVGIKNAGKLDTYKLWPVAFVPLTGLHGWH